MKRKSFLISVAVVVATVLAAAPGFAERRGGGGGGHAQEASRGSAENRGAGVRTQPRQAPVQAPRMAERVQPQRNEIAPRVYTPRGGAGPVFVAPRANYAPQYGGRAVPVAPRAVPQYDGRAAVPVAPRAAPGYGGGAYGGGAVVAPRAVPRSGGGAVTVAPRAVPGYGDRAYGGRPYGGRVYGGGAVGVAPRAVPRVEPRGDFGYRGGAFGYRTPWYGYRGYAPFRPYYFRPWYRFGFGVFVGYPVAYYAYPYAVPVYGYGAPYDEVAVGPTSAYGGVALQFTPGNAAVSVDGAYAGTVHDFDGSREPLTLTAGVHHIEIDLDGYQPIAFDVTVQPGQVIPYQGSMQPY